MFSRLDFGYYANDSETRYIVYSKEKWMSITDVRRAELERQAPEFEYYVKKVRGFLAMPCGIWAIILYEEFLGWQNEQKTNTD